MGENYSTCCSDYGSITAAADILENMFGPVIDRQAIVAILESCNGDITESVEVVSRVTSESTEREEKSSSEHKSDAQLAVTDMLESSSELHPAQPKMSYAGAFKSSAPAPSPKQDSKKNLQTKSVIQWQWTDQLRKIITYHNAGYRTLIIMRGLPGSGKSYLARKLIEMTIGSETKHYDTHIYSTNDYFSQTGCYLYDLAKIGIAHDWNKQRVRNAIKRGVSPIIVDNTNIEMWELKPYVFAGVDEGYFIEVVEPDTTWAKNVYQLHRRNEHNVPLLKIKKMFDAYKEKFTTELLFETYGITYAPEKTPPILRLFPTCENIIDKTEYNETESTFVNVSTRSSAEENSELYHRNDEVNVITQTLNNPINSDLLGIQVDAKKNVNISKDHPEIDLSANEDSYKGEFVEVESNEVNDELTEKEKEMLKSLEERERQLETFIKLEKEWEMGGEWVEVDNKSTEACDSKNVKSVIIPQPQRKRGCGDTILSDIKLSNDWQQIKYNWECDNPSSYAYPEFKQNIQMISTSTCFEIGDTDIHGFHNYKVLAAVPRDINACYMQKLDPKIPKQRMFDKSTMTNEHSIINIYKCKNEEHRFAAFCNMFNTLPVSDLRDVFDKCHGDVNWAVEIILDSMANHQFDYIQNEEMPVEDKAYQFYCNCEASYDIVPNLNDGNEPIQAESANEVASTSVIKRKIKKEKTISDSTSQLKRQIEQNINISDKHYSDHCLKVRKLRRGEISENAVDSTSQLYTEDNENDCCNRSESNSSSDGEDKTTIDVYLGRDFIRRLDDIYGRGIVKYSDHVVPVVSMPIDLLNQINAVWMESLTNQIEASVATLDLKEDEEYARQIAEEELAAAGASKENEPLKFKEIMDMDLAMALYQKNVDQWKSNDMASRMTREKLCNLFPNVTLDIISELLNNFYTTVKILLASTGQIEVLASKESVNKFIMDGELARQQKILEYQRQDLSEEERPVLSKSQEKVDMSLVEKFRQQAQNQLIRRNIYYATIRECQRNGMSQAVPYYSQMAAFHQRCFEQANSRAAQTLIQFHSIDRCDSTLDLHKLYLLEALEALDLYSSIDNEEERPKKQLSVLHNWQGGAQQGRTKD